MPAISKEAFEDLKVFYPMIKAAFETRLPGRDNGEIEAYAGWCEACDDPALDDLPETETPRLGKIAKERSRPITETDALASTPEAPEKLAYLADAYYTALCNHTWAIAEARETFKRARGYEIDFLKICGAAHGYRKMHSEQIMTA